MKKIIMIGLSLSLLFSITACSVGSSVDEDNSNDEVTETTSTGKQEIDLTDYVLYDDDYCTISFNYIDSSRIEYYSVDLRLTNKLTDQTLTFDLTECHVNGVYFSRTETQTVDANSSNDLYFNLKNELAVADGLIDFTDIELKFLISTGDFSEDVIFHIYPYGEEYATVYADEREMKDGDAIIIDNEFVRVIYIGDADSSVDQYATNLYVINKSNLKNYYQITNVIFNNISYSLGQKFNINAERSYFLTVYWGTMKTAYEEGFSDITSFQFYLVGYYDEAYTSRYMSELATLVPLN